MIKAIAIAIMNFGSSFIVSQNNDQQITFCPPIYGLSTSGTVMLPSSF